MISALRPSPSWIIRGIARRISFSIRNFSPQQRRLATSRPDQRTTFARLASRFAETYEEMRSHGTRSFVTPFWNETNRHLETILLPRPRFDLLNDATIESLMFRSVAERSSAEELSSLEDAVPEEDLRSAIQEDHVGVPRVIHPKYLASVNTVHHCFLLHRFLARTGVQASSLNTVVEWGGGVGGFAKVFIRSRPLPTTYVLLDTPLIACLQWLYLSTIFGEDRVNVLRRPNDLIVPHRFNVASVAFVDKVSDGADLFVSSFALSESSSEARRYVAYREWFGARHLLLVMQSKASSTYTRGADLVEVARRAGVRLEAANFHSNDYYGFR